MVYKLSPIFVERELARRKISLFRLQDFARVFKLKPETARVFLSRRTKAGDLQRARRGLYFSAAHPPSTFEMANKLLEPSYISFETALSHYGIIPDTVYTITSATTRRPQEFEVKGQSYQFRKIKKSLYFGYEPRKIRGATILIASPEKALLDYLYFASLYKKAVIDRIDVSGVNAKRFREYAGVFAKKVRKNRTLLNRIEEIYDNKAVY